MSAELNHRLGAGVGDVEVQLLYEGTKIVMPRYPLKNLGQKDRRVHIIIWRVVEWSPSWAVWVKVELLPSPRPIVSRLPGTRLSALLCFDTKLAVVETELSYRHDVHRFLVK